MIDVLSCFTIVNVMTDDERSHLVDSVTGFFGMEVMGLMGGPAENWLMMRWIDQLANRPRHQGNSYHASPKSITKGLNLVPGSTGIRLFEIFAD